MNSKYRNIGQLIAEEVVYEPGTAIFSNKFKLPHKGSWEVFKQLVSKNYITKILVIISNKEIEGITAQDAKFVWDTFLECDSEPKVSVQIASSESPVRDAFGIIAKNPKETFYFVYNPNETDDDSAVKSLQKSFGDRVYGLPFDDKADDGTSAPKLRDAAEAGDFDAFIKMMPEPVINKGGAAKIFKRIAPKVKTELRELLEAGFPAPLSYKDKLDEFVKFVSDGLGIENIPTVEYLATTEFKQKEHSFGGFLPSENKIIVVVANRNLADIMRSTAHELVHARQNEVDGLKPGDGETGSEIENQANAVAGVILRLYGKNNPDIYLDWVSATE
jgi:hypothetical protein